MNLVQRLLQAATGWMTDELDFESARRKMVDEQLRRRNITDARVLTAMERIPRERFVPEETQALACADRALPVACGQTISQPFMVALMTQALRLQGTESVLEIGTGSGYQAAILSALAGTVISVERHAPLAETARERLRALGCDNVEIRVGDGTLGCPDAAPFDRVIVTAGGPQIPPDLFDQLAEGGILVMPVGDEKQQSLLVVRKRQGEPVTTNLSGCRFVKLIGDQGWPGDETDP
ncbi:MAG: protein-L-isoaspartate(D-aspartate) O-methyltransferase [Planctomycetales bacterium]